MGAGSKAVRVHAPRFSAPSGDATNHCRRKDNCRGKLMHPTKRGKQWRFADVAASIAWWWKALMQLCNNRLFCLSWHSRGHCGVTCVGHATKTKRNTTVFTMNEGMLLPTDF
ncbi:hypothetical protein COCVIDRAFT_21129 [Bipolaris victoriae FI3]|uniref:Uncharacterized protein n=1 Tax=Bipolaris victoriae (strain FI3) TaxID=930091 RepID=W7E4B4_BIPV3|nr:hypothetical protein COCVIDRAFT_21129 [Bipolaris victoriae FI3]